MRSGGGLGEFSTGSTQLSVAASCERLGNSDATWPSGPRPKSMASKTGSPASKFRFSHRAVTQHSTNIPENVLQHRGRSLCAAEAPKKWVTEATDAPLVPVLKPATPKNPSKACTAQLEYLRVSPMSEPDVALKAASMSVSTSEECELHTL